MAQAGQYPPLHQQDARFNLGLVAGLADPGRMSYRHRGAPVVVCERTA